MNQLADDELDLSLGGSSGKNMEFDEMFLNRMIQDDYQNDFQITRTALVEVESRLTELMESKADLHPTNPTSSLGRLLYIVREGQKKSLVGVGLSNMAKELEFISSNLWSNFKSTLISILENRPANLDITQLAFRCEKLQELTNLLHLSSQSKVFQLLTETFASELYTHCLKRKLALIKIFNLRPSSVVKQVVEIYLKPPGQPYSQQGISAVGFNLQASLAMHGPLDRVALQVLGSLNSLSPNYHSELVSKFKRDCGAHITSLNGLWTSLDSLASLMSSPMTDLVSFNNQIKLIAPQLIFATVCSQLASQ